MSGERGKVSNYKVLAYGMGSLGNNIIFALINTYLLFFYTDVFGLTAGSIGIMFLIARIWDGANDPIMGVIVDNTKSKWGRFRPYLLFVPFIMAVFTVLTFLNPNLSNTGKLIYAYITYIAWGMSFTAMDIPYWSMSSTITLDPVERNKVVMVPRTLAMVGFLLVNVLTLPLISVLDDIDLPILGQINPWTLLAALYSMIAIVLTLTTFFFVREEVTPKREKRQTLKDVLELFKANKPLRMIIYTMLVLEGINTIRIVLAIYYLTHNLNSESLIPIFLGLYLLMNIVGAIIVPVLAKRIGKKAVAMNAIFLTTATSIGMFITGYANAYSLSFIFLWNIIGAIAMGASNIVMTSMIADCVEYGQWKTGNRAEGMVFSTNIFKTKLATALGGAIGAFALHFAGYKPEVIPTKETLDTIHFSFTLLPAFISLIAIIPLYYYELTEKKFAEILGQLKT